MSFKTKLIVVVVLSVVVYFLLSTMRVDGQTDSTAPTWCCEITKTSTPVPFPTPGGDAFLPSVFNVKAIHTSTPQPPPITPTSTPSEPPTQLLVPITQTPGALFPFN